MTTKEALESSTAQPSKNDVTARVVLITGALTGIGRATALGFAREGARIVVSGRHDDKGKALAAELQELGAEATFIKSRKPSFSSFPIKPLTSLAHPLPLTVESLLAKAKRNRIAVLAPHPNQAHANRHDR
jgi:NAD(P)-dependent dehydrogenase (short-subunit alcohol dehydrogenase family)